jgi:hypothetical protein
MDMQAGEPALFGAVAQGITTRLFLLNSKYWVVSKDDVCK